MLPKAQRNAAQSLWIQPSSPSIARTQTREWDDAKRLGNFAMQIAAFRRLSSSRDLLQGRDTTPRILYQLLSGVLDTVARKSVKMSGGRPAAVVSQAVSKSLNPAKRISIGYSVPDLRPVIRLLSYPYLQLDTPSAKQPNTANH